MIYEIPAVNIGSLEDRLKKVQKKCAKLKCSFKYEKISEFYKPIKQDGKIYKAKFIKVDIEGIAVINGWEFLAVIDHLPKGNILRKIRNVEIPEKYRDTPPFCEHCHRNRFRNNTYIVHNTSTNEFKQVGKSCLKEFTGGISAEHAACLESFFKEVEEFKEVSQGGSWGYGPIYETLDDVLCFSIETIKKYGYHKRENFDSISNNIPTGEKVLAFLLVSLYGGTGIPKRDREIEDEMKETNFNPYSEENKELCNKIKEWILSSENNTDYFHNLRVIVSSEYVDRKYLGIVSSSVVAYKRAHPENQKESDFVGNVGEQIRFAVKSCVCIWAGEYYRRISRIYRITDKDDNVLIWRTSNIIRETPKYLRGYIKEHSTYKGVKQTILTRCKALENPLD